MQLCMYVKCKLYETIDLPSINGLGGAVESDKVCTPHPTAFRHSLHPKAFQP